MSDINDESLKKKLFVESNAKLIEWSDGTFGMAIGDEIFEIREDVLQNSGVFLKYD